MILSLLTIAIFQGLVFGLIVLNSPFFKSNANKYLAYAILSLSVSLLNYTLDDWTGVYQTIPLFRFIDIIDSATIFPVLFFLFILHQVNHPLKKAKKKLWLFVPYIYSFLNSIIYEIYNLNNGFIFSENLINNLDIIELIMLVLFIPSILIFTYTHIKFSVKPQEKKWILRMWLLVSILFMSFILAILSSFLFNNETKYLPLLLSLIAVFLIHWNAYVGVYKLKLVKDQKEIKALLERRKSILNNKLISNNLIDSESLNSENNYFKELEILCVKHHIYKNHNLDRDMVSEKLGISSGYISQIINTVTGNNFSTFINKYRVEAVKKMILDPEFENYSLLAIGLECGFASKSTFYNSFKRMENMTPNAFRKANK